MQNHSKKILYGSSLVLVAIVFFLLGFYQKINYQVELNTQTNVFNNSLQAEASSSSEQLDFSAFWKVWNILNKKNPDSLNVANEDKVYGAIQGLASSLNDPYTIFLPPTENKLFNESISGEFNGIGIEVGMKDKILTVIAPIKDTPAYLAGIKSGDKIFKIDDTSTADLSIDEAIALIRGKKGTNVKITIIREGEKEPLEFNIKRDVIKLPTLETKREGDIFIIQLYNFSANSSSLFKKAMKEYTDSKMTKLIIDLRGNPGGFLDASIDITSWFLPAGETIVIEDFGNKALEKTNRSAGYNIFDNKKMKLVILIDGGSASASEILAGALHDHGIATLVGETTFGKGSVQELISITPNTSLKVTVAKWLTPKRISISKAGIEPDIKVEITKKDVENKIDPQMNKALEILKN